MNRNEICILCPRCTEIPIHPDEDMCIQCKKEAYKYQNTRTEKIK